MVRPKEIAGIEIVHAGDGADAVSAADDGMREHTDSGRSDATCSLI
jgi:hypothetical protein